MTQHLLIHLPPLLPFTPLPPLKTHSLPLLSPLFLSSMANLAPRITNIVHIPYFLKRPALDFDTQLAKFKITCVANDVHIAKFQEVLLHLYKKMHFHGIKDNHHFVDWNALRIAFLAHFRPLGFATNLKEKLQTIRVGSNERVDNYNGRMQDILQHMGSRQILDDFLMSIFIDGIYPIELRVHVKGGATAT